MKRLITLAVFATAAAAILAMPTSAAKDTKGPACTNITFGNYGYQRLATDDSGLGEATITLDAPACDNASYFLDVYNFAGTGNPLINDISPTSIDGTLVTFDFSFAPGTAPDDGVCLVAESRIGGGGHVSDRAPDSGCRQVANGSAGGDGGFS